MASWKYTVDTTTASGALFPVPAQASSKAWRYGMVHVTGVSGNEAIPSPKPAALPDGPLMRSAQPSFNSPDVITPSIYYTSVSNMGPASDGIRVKSTNELPIPAKNAVRIPLIAQRAPRYGGLRQVTWPPAPLAWQNVATGGNQ